METYEIWERDDAATLKWMDGKRQRERAGLVPANADLCKQQTTIHTKQVMKLLQVIPNPTRCSTATGSPRRSTRATTNTLQANPRRSQNARRHRKGEVRGLKASAACGTEVAPIDRSKVVSSFSSDPVDVPQMADRRIQARDQDRRDHPANKETALALVASRPSW